MLAEADNDPAANERRWQKELAAYEAIEGRFTPTQIEAHVREIGFIHCETHNNHLPGIGSEAAKRIEAKALELKVVSINTSIAEFEERYGATAQVKRRPCCAEIEDQVEKLRKLVDEMKPGVSLVTQFRDDINRHAAAALLASDVPQGMISILLGTAAYKAPAAKLETALGLN